MSAKQWMAAALVVMCAACSDDDDPQDPGTETYAATLSGAAERPNPVTTSATGTFTMTVNANRTINYSLTVQGMTPSAQHIHGPADENTSAGVIVGVNVGINQALSAATSFTGAVSYDSLLVLLRNNRAYVNVHSAAYPGGEIRGNLRRQ
jgi:hypothetical protein